MTKYIVPISSPDGRSGDELEVEADSVDEALAVVQQRIDDPDDGVSSMNVIGTPRLG